MVDEVIISDTSCLIALARINRLNILSELFPYVHITPEVEIEFGMPLPGWIKVEEVIDEERKIELKKIVDLGEASAIALALERKDCLLIIDEKKGRRLAQSLNITIAGTLQILLLAKLKNILPSLSKIIAELEEQGFHISVIIKKEILKLANEE